MSTACPHLCAGSRSALALAAGALAAAHAHATPASDVEKYSGGPLELVGRLHADHRGRPGQGDAQRRGQVLPATPGKIPLGLRRALAAAGARRRQGDLVLRQGLAQANVRRMDATLASTPADALVGDGLGARSSSTSRRCRTRRAAVVSTAPKHPNSGFPAGANRVRQRGRARLDVPRRQAQPDHAADLHAPVKNPKLIPDLFTFSPPPGVDVIGRDSK